MQSTIPLDPRVFKVARIQVTKLIGASPKEIVFLSGEQCDCEMTREGFEVAYLPVKTDGLVDLERLKEAIKPDAGLVSIVRFGVVQPMEEIGGSLLMGLKEVAVSSASACTSVSLEPSYVLRALGVDEDMSHTSIRFGIGRFTTEEEIDKPVRAYG
uniref:Uncharacterized protein n=1 Tax=Brassica campestris TaxID=3711 RepID=M4E6L0_BRACM